jgi:hypothetical protein
MAFARLAFAKAIGRRPDLEPYQKDKRHSTLAGNFGRDRG